MVVELRFPERRAPPEPPPSGRTHARALAAVPFFRERARRWGEDGGTGTLHRGGGGGKREKGPPAAPPPPPRHCSLSWTFGKSRRSLASRKRCDEDEVLGYTANTFGIEDVE